MEELIPIILIFVVSSIFSSLKKNKQQMAAEQKRWNTTAAQTQTAQTRSKSISQSTPAKSFMQPVSYADVPGQVMQPTVHTHLQPDCETHDVPGSLGAVSTEGKDPCHEEQLSHPRMTEEAAPAEQGGLSFSWTGSDLVKAVVMQEVLTRPAQRRAR